MKKQTEIDTPEFHTEMMEAAKLAVSGKGDGRISKADGEKNLNIHKDNPGEQADLTLQEIMKTHKHTLGAMDLMKTVVGGIGTGEKLIGDYVFDLYNPPLMKNLSKSDWTKYLNRFIWKDPTSHMLNGVGFVNKKEEMKFDLSKLSKGLDSERSGTLTSTRAWIRKGQLVSLFADTERKHLEVFISSLTHKTTMAAILETSVSEVAASVKSSLKESITRQTTEKTSSSSFTLMSIKKNQFTAHWRQVYIHELVFDPADGPLPCSNPFVFLEDRKISGDQLPLDQISSFSENKDLYEFNLAHPPLLRNYYASTIPSIIKGPVNTFRKDFNLAKLTNGKYVFIDICGDNGMVVSKNQSISQYNGGQPVTVKRQYIWRRTKTPTKTLNKIPKIEYETIVDFTSSERSDVEMSLSASVGLQVDIFSANAQVTFSSSSMFEESTERIIDNKMTMKDIPAGIYYTNWQLEEHIFIYFDNFDLNQNYYIIEKGKCPYVDSGSMIMESSLRRGPIGPELLDWDDFLLGVKGYFSTGITSCGRNDLEGYAWSIAFTDFKDEYASKNESSFSVLNMYGDSCEASLQDNPNKHLPGFFLAYIFLNNDYTPTWYKMKRTDPLTITFINNTDKIVDINCEVTNDATRNSCWNSRMSKLQPGSQKKEPFFDPNDILQVVESGTSNVLGVYKLIERPAGSSKLLTIVIEEYL